MNKIIPTIDSNKFDVLQDLMSIIIRYFSFEVNYDENTGLLDCISLYKKDTNELMFTINFIQ